MKFSPYLILAAGAAIVWWLWKYLQGSAAAAKVLPPTQAANIKARAASVSSARAACESKGGYFEETTYGSSCSDVSYTTPGGTTVTDNRSFIEQVAPGANFSGSGGFASEPVSGGTAYGQAAGDPNRPSGFGAH